MPFRSIFMASAMTVAVCAVSLPAQAVTITGDYSGVWLPGVGGVASSTVTYATPATGATFDPIVTITNVSLEGGGSFTTGAALEVDQVPTSWFTWAGGYTGQVLYSGYQVDSITLALSGLYALGFEIEPNNPGPFDITLALITGETLTQNVNGISGAKFYGYFGHGVTSLTITALSSNESFAFGNFRSVAAVPLPAALPLLAGAIGALGAFGHWRSRRRQHADAHPG